MNIKKISAAVIAAVVLAVAAPMTGVLPEPLSVVASAASPDPMQTEYKAGDVFYAGIDSDGAFNGNCISSKEMAEDYSNLNAVDAYRCTVKSDGTIKIAYELLPAVYYKLYGKTLTVPNEIGGYTVSEIENNDHNFAESGCKKIIIPDTVKTIGQSAFAFCCFLEEVEFSSNSQLELIEQWAFQDCRSLKSITIPASVETIMEMAFGNTNEKLDKFYEPYQGTKFDFTDTYSLTAVNFADGSKLKLIDQWAFQGQEALKSITLPDSLEKIGYGVFNHCTALTNINIPQNVNEIGAFAFQIDGWNYESGNISEITVDENNPNFKSVDGILFSKDGKTIVAYPVAKSGKYDIPADVNKIAEAAFGSCQKLTAVSIPEGVVDIPENAFTYCAALAEVKLPSTLKTIGKWGFEACAFTSIDIPESVTSIDANAFDSTPLKNINGVAGSYAETFAKQNGYTFNSGSSETPSKPDDTSKPTDTPNTFTDDSGDKAADIEVIAKPNVIPKEAHFSVRLDDKNTTAERIAYNCYFTYNGGEYEPTDTVTVRIPVPVAMRDIANTLKVYHLQDGKYVNMSAKVEDGYLVFDTDHFSVYVVTAENLENGGTSTPTTSDTSSSAPTSSDTASSAPTDPDKGNPDTGVTAIAVTAGAAALAGAVALVARKKRK